jgi:hypothetical protein
MNAAALAADGCWTTPSERHRFVDKRFVSPCGLTCCDCLFYQGEVFEAARWLRELIRKHELDEFLSLLGRPGAWKAIGEHLLLSEDEAWEGMGKHLETFKHMPAFLDVLDSMIAVQCTATCQEAGGCSLGEGTRECGALRCVRSKGYDGCWDCREFESCDKLQFLKRSYGHVIDENLAIARDKGVGAVEPRGKKYYVWQRRKAGGQTG